MVRRALAALFTVAVAVSLLHAPAPALAADAGFGLDLEGQWRFSTGDDMDWKEPGFDDGEWERVAVPEEGGQAVFDDYDGFAWFRKTFRVPEAARGQSLIAALGGIDDADEAYLNGRLIGKSGTFPDEGGDSQWFERRLYSVPSAAINYGGRNTLAIRVNDFTGGGGWYKGPVGLFAKSRIRSEVYGLDAPLASRGKSAAVKRVLDRQARAVRRGAVKAYARTLGPKYNHDGFDKSRRVAELRTLKRSYGTLRLVDREVEVVRKRGGRLAADSNRRIDARVKGKWVTVRGPEQTFLHFNPRTLRENGNRSRFFRDGVDSELEGKRREFNVYLPPGYHRNSGRRYPVIYLLHGINGGNREWEARDINRRFDRMYRRDDRQSKAIIVMPDGESLWYVDSSAAPWRSMFIEEMLPLVDDAYRTRADRRFRALSGISMGGHGAFTVGWAHQDLFGSIASHMGALDLPPLAGTGEEIAANSDETPNVQVNRHTPEFLSSFSYYFDACEDDEFKFDDAARAMDGQLDSKFVEHVFPPIRPGRHNDECSIPYLKDGFAVHSATFSGTWGS